ncbi:Hypothetical protein CINCED_3A004155 [Cinara cedri]|nr:Hypothetical protein CINCED_3A004155 [Cinara cedri]
MVRAPQPSPQISEAIGSPGFPAGNGRGEPAVGVATGLPAFLAALKPKYDCFDARRCRQCHVPSSVVPAHWTDSFHRTLHRLRSAVMPPPSAFAAGRSRLSYRVISIRPERYNDEWLRGVRQYVDTELGLSETGIPRYTRSAYVSLLSGPAASVVGYLEAEPAAVAYVLGPDGQLSAADTGRRRVRYGVSRLWVTVGYRRLGIGTTMLNAFRADHSVHGRHVAFAAHEIQFGDAFVRHYCTAAARQDPVTASADVLIYTDSSAWYK